MSEGTGIIDLSQALERRRRERLRVIKEAERVALAVSERLGGATVLLHGSYARGDFNAWSDVDLIVVSEAFNGVRPLDRLSLIEDLLPPGYQAIAWTTEELKVMLGMVTWKAALCRGYIILVDGLDLAAYIEASTGCQPLEADGGGE